MSRALLALLLAAAALGCGKYGPPVRASEQKPPEKKTFEIPLPGAQPPAPAPAAPPTPEVEEEPPPEGAP